MKHWTSVEWNQMMRLSNGVLLSLLCSSFLRMSLWLGQIQGELLSVCELCQILEQCCGTLNSLLKDTLTVRGLLLKSYAVVLLTVTNMCVPPSRPTVPVWEPPWLLSTMSSITLSSRTSPGDQEAPPPGWEDSTSRFLDPHTYLMCR